MLQSRNIIITVLQNNIFTDFLQMLVSQFGIY